ncbi:YtpI family protein [Robertmurraya massiliosenegalensis]|uniref:YtpI family protein n=1 Tax=Robertmurraya massiliosenegalensis TaxID=1287657 RepID=UPI0002E1E57E|nr:YtpI family protein [Robertmurraya massiliosenegalensis]
MPVLVILFVFAFSFYIFYKVKYFRTQKPAEKKWISAKASVALGLFVALFGVNQYFINQTTVGYIVGSIFLLLGAINIWGGMKSYKFYLPHAIEEAEQLKK